MKNNWRKLVLYGMFCKISGMKCSLFSYSTKKEKEIAMYLINTKKTKKI